MELFLFLEKKHAAILLYLAVTPDENGFLIRNLIRNTWAIEAKFNNIEVIFSIGIKTEAELNQTNITDDIIEENQRFNDILMANFVDRWENLLLKWWSNNYYHSSRCSQIPLMASMDSDAVLFGKNLKKLLDNTSNTFDGYLGCTILLKQPIVRDHLDRYYVNEWQWPGKACEKMSQMIPQLGIHYITGFRIFDVLTGPIAQAAGLQLRNLPGIHPWLPVNDICNSLIFVIHPIEADKLADFYQYRLVNLII
uniref:Hexosyltransferase n=1 Tax=Onchocerca volvulus TaxID=6282 RepID=A0A8R1Y4W6_ONCVO